MVEAREVVGGLKRHADRLRGLRAHLQHLAAFPGDTWQERWVAAGNEADLKHWRTVDCDQQASANGLHTLLTLDVVRPSYAWLKANQFKTWFQILASRDPEGYEALEGSFETFGKTLYDNRAAVVVLAHIACRTGKNVLNIRGEDLLAYHHAMRGLRVQGTKAKSSGTHHAWDCLRVMGTLDHPADTLRLAQLRGQLTVTELVDRHGIRSETAREGLIRYLRSREGRLDHSSLRSLATSLCGLFWADLEQHHPGIDSFDLSDEVARQWKTRLATKADGSERRSRFSVMLQVRAMYLDIAMWSQADPTWAPWAANTPVDASDVAGYSKQQRENKARSHQRTRERAPEVDRLLRATEERLRWATARLNEVSALAPGEAVVLDGLPYRRIGSAKTMLRPTEPGKNDLDLSNIEEQAFWAWATVHLLHQTGLRIEELLELDQFSIQRFKNPQTGDVVPLLHVYPAKGGSERLLAASPELVHVLARIVHRLRQSDGRLPLTTRYDNHEKVALRPAPLLFQRHVGRWRSMSYQYIYGLLDEAGTWAGLTRADGSPLTFRPHDLRRIFATDAQSSGVPIHVIASILGHESIETTAIYAAVYSSDIIDAHTNFIAKRRAKTNSADQREITEEEWKEFQRHFVERKLSLGTCGRSWGSSCEHEHACVRCALLRPDPASLHRFIEIRDNLTERIEEANAQGWLGEVEGLTTSLLAATDKIERLQAIVRAADEPTFLGLPSRNPTS